MKVKYVQIGKPITIKKFEMYNAPKGWYRLDILRKKLKENKEFRMKFSLKELKQIKESAK